MRFDGVRGGGPRGFLEVLVRREFAMAIRVLGVMGLAVLIFFPAAGNAQRGALTIQQNLEQLVDEAGTIVEGYVISRRVEPHPEFSNLTTVVVQFRVKDVLKGEAGETLTYRQYIWDLRDRYDGAGYKKGRHVLLMLIPVNQYGLTSPVGMQQGRFRIVRDREGNEFGVNGLGNSGLLRGLSAEARTRISREPALSVYLAEGAKGPVPLDDLRALIRGLAR